MRKTIFTFLFLFSIVLIGQIPADYYSTATGSGYALKTQLHNIIDDHNAQSYSSLWDFYELYELDKYYENDGTILDVYSENPTGTDPYNYTKVSDQCGNYSGEGSCYNREHSFPKSWFNDATPMYTDVFHIVASDGYVNGRRGNFPFGEVGSASYTSSNGSKLGSARSGLGYSGTVFEPIDEFKGDMARIYFYMATRYEDIISGWQNNSAEANAALNGTSNQVYENWVITMLMDWHTSDPVSQKEIDRNNAAYSYQGNRNPFVDHPEWVNVIWGDGSIILDPVISTSAVNGGYNLGTIASNQTSASINYQVSGSNLEGNVTVSVLAPFQVSLNNSSWSQSVAILASNAEANSSNTVYVRFAPTVANGQTYNSSISHTSTNAATKFVSLTGKEGLVGSNPAISVSTPLFNGDFGQTIVGENSAATSYTVSGADLNSDLVITAPDHFAVSLSSSSGFTSMIALAPTNGLVNSTTIYVDFNPTIGGAISGAVTNSSGATVEELSVLGFGVIATSTNSLVLDRIYPNPANNLLVLEGVNPNQSIVRIFNSNGTRQVVKWMDQAVDVSDFPPGVYYVSIDSKGQKSVAKVMINR